MKNIFDARSIHREDFLRKPEPWYGLVPLLHVPTNTTTGPKGEPVATRNDSSVLWQIHTLIRAGSIGDLTDGQLLERFATSNDEAAGLAFAALVERHGPMVLRVCRSVLANPHDTQDAFQATFLVLVKKARGLWVRDSLGAWLHQVAFRTASSALKEAIRRRRHERRAAELATQNLGGQEEGVGPEMERLLHAEINRLPEPTACPSCSAISRVDRTRKRRGISVGRSGPSRAGFHGDGIGSVTGSATSPLLRAWSRWSPRSGSMASMT